MDGTDAAVTAEPKAETKRIEALDIARIMHAIPHRFPFLLVDRVVEVVPNESAIGIKNVSINENYFQGHFPTHPVMPGVLIIESMAQTAAVLVVETLGADAAGKLVYFMMVENAKFRRATRCASMCARTATAAMSGSSRPKPRSTDRSSPNPPSPR